MSNERVMEKLGSLRENIRASFKPKKETKKQFMNRMEGRHDAYKQAKKAGRLRDKEMREATINADKNLRERPE